jgi:hypothetical protein
MALNQIDPLVQEIHNRALARRVYRQMRRFIFTKEWVKDWAKNNQTIRDELNKCHKEHQENEKRNQHTER